MANDGKKQPDETFGIGRLFDELGAAVEKLNNLAEQGQRWSKKVGSDDGDGPQAIVDIRIRTAQDAARDASVRTEGASRRSPVSPDADASEEREVPIQERQAPPVDIFDEDGHVLVVAEMPGIAARDIDVQLTDDVLAIEATTEDRQYATEVLLPRVATEVQTVQANNGIIEIKCLV